MVTEIRPRGPFSLAASTAFLEGFTPAAYTAPGEAGHLHLAFALDGHDAVAAVCATQPGGPDEAVLIDMVVEGEAPDSAAGDQLARVLSLDIDGTGYPAVGQRDRIVGRLQERYRGLRPVLFASPYEAAAWALIGARIAIRQAARVKERMAAELGTELTIHGDRVVAFPGPGRLRTIEDFPGLFGRKAEYLRGLAAAAIEGRLDSANLRAMAEPDALAALRTITGSGRSRPNWSCSAGSAPWTGRRPTSPASPGPLRLPTNARSPMPPSSSRLPTSGGRSGPGSRSSSGPTSRKRPTKSAAGAADAGGRLAVLRCGRVLTAELLTGPLRRRGHQSGWPSPRDLRLDLPERCLRSPRVMFATNSRPIAAGSSVCTVGTDVREARETVGHCRAG